MLPDLKLHSQTNPDASTSFCSQLLYHPKDSADLAAAISRASFGDAEPL
jgi:hypothetical protein